MKRSSCLTALVVLAGIRAAHAQAPAFEVVSIKPSAPDQSTVSSRGGPGTRTPGMWTCQNMSLHNVIGIAFNLNSQQLIAPEWTKEPRFDITAKVPEGATREQFFQMLQNMLVERFGLKFHRDQQQVQGFELSIAKGGPKFQESAPEPPKDPAAVPPPPLTPAQLRPTP